MSVTWQKKTSLAWAFFIHLLAVSSGTHDLEGKCSRGRKRKESSHSVLNSSACILFCSGCHNKIAQTAWLKQQKWTAHSFWRLGVQNQGVSRFGFSWGLALRLANSRLLSSYVLTRPFLCIHIPGLFLLFMRTHNGLGPHFWPNLNPLFKGPHFKYSHTGGWASTHEFGKTGGGEGDTIHL